MVPGSKKMEDQYNQQRLFYWFCFFRSLAGRKNKQEQRHPNYCSTKLNRMILPLVFEFRNRTGQSLDNVLLLSKYGHDATIEVAVGFPLSIGKDSELLLSSLYEELDNNDYSRIIRRITIESNMGAQTVERFDIALNAEWQKPIVPCISPYQKRSNVQIIDIDGDVSIDSNFSIRVNTFLKDAALRIALS